MTEQQALDTILEIVRPFVRNREKLSTAGASTRWEDLQVDSLRFVDLVLVSEERFDIVIDEDDMEKLQKAHTMGAAARLLIESLAARPDNTRRCHGPTGHRCAGRAG